MRLQGASGFWLTTTFIVGVAVCLLPGRVRAQEPYTYEDDFRDSFAESRSYRHSVFWPYGAFPPAEPYLYYAEDESEGRELGFGDRHGVWAFLGYRFTANENRYTRYVDGILRVDVRFPNDTNVGSSGSGVFGYQVSADGVEWSEAVYLGPGDGQEIYLESVWGTCHVVFFGTDVLIDNINVRLQPKAATIYVPSEHSTIQAAIDHSVKGDVIQVAPGTYRGPGNRDITFPNWPITLRSERGPGQTTIDCSGGRGFYFDRDAGPDFVLRGFTIAGGRAPDSPLPSEADEWKQNDRHPVGGGIFCDSGSPTIVNCVIKNCTAELGGGIGVVGGSPAIYDCVIEQCLAGGSISTPSRGFGAGIGLIRRADAKIFDCTLKNNRAYSDSLGAGLYCRQSSAKLVKCEISGNRAQGSVTGGGVHCSGAIASIELEKCLITNNTAENGAGVFAEGFDEARLTNCTVANNRLSGSMASAGGIRSVNGDMVIKNSIVYYNDGTEVSLSNPVSPNPVIFSNVDGGFPGHGNIDEDPCFASPAAGDYRLKSMTGRYDPGSYRWVDDYPAHSPCIDAGDPQGPVGAEPFPNRGRVNMGAYGGTTEASMSSSGVIFHVDGSDGSGGRDSNSGLSRNNAFKTIGRALLEPKYGGALDGDIILVWPGVYREALEINNRAVTIQSAAEAAVIAAPNLNVDTSYGVSFYNAGSGAVLRNFIITDCDISAIYCASALPTLENLTIVGNQFGMEAWGAVPTVTSCIFWNNADGDINMNVRPRYSCLQQLVGLEEDYNISEDPLFADPANGDYHLQSGNGRYSAGNSWVNDELTSPCIDGGDPTTYAGREAVPHGGTVNMGAYGGTPFASRSTRLAWDDFSRGLSLDLTE